MPSNEIHVANSTNEELILMVAPNSDWAIGDIVGSVVQLLASAASTVVTLGGTAPTTFAALFSCINLIRGGISAGFNLADVLKQNGGISIAPGQVTEVFNRGMANPFKYLNSSQWGALFGGSDMTLAITNKSLTRQAVFNTNSDYSWIVTKNEVVRAKYGSLWQEDPGSGSYPFSIGAQLIPGQELQVGESIAAKNQESHLVLQSDGNLVVYHENKPTRGKAIWAADTYGKGGTKLVMTTDGISLQKPDGTVLWSQNHANSNTLVMQDDHNLVLYDNSKKVLWASNTMNAK